jgi:hypothetical protein
MATTHKEKKHGNKPYDTKGIFEAALDAKAIFEAALNTKAIFEAANNTKATFESIPFRRIVFVTRDEGELRETK